MDGNNWHDPVWRAGADQWITARLAERGTPVTGPIEQFRVRPWSVTCRVPTAGGWYWFKANTFHCRYEVRLAEALAGWVPESVPTPVALHPGRGWLLTADAGTTLREASAQDRATDDAPTRDAALNRWAALLEEYAELQRTLAPRVDAMVALGVPDQRPTAMPELLDRLLQDPVVRADLGPDRAAAVTAVMPDVLHWCEELGADGLPASLQHDDLHDGNVFASTKADQSGRYRFFDWGDASVAHPFGTLLVALSAATHTFDLSPGAPELARLRDAYLSGWPGGTAMLRRSATLACRVTRISRALAWSRALDGSALPLDDDIRAAPAEWLAELTQPDVL
ncbi:phosphotransferase [Micromonospora sonneratiae]